MSLRDTYMRWGIEYTNTCWSCGSSISSRTSRKCRHCGWYICTGCGHCADPYYNDGMVCGDDIREKNRNEFDALYDLLFIRISKQKLYPSDMEEYDKLKGHLDLATTGEELWIVSDEADEWISNLSSTKI